MTHRYLTRPLFSTSPIIGMIAIRVKTSVSVFYYFILHKSKQQRKCGTHKTYALWLISHIQLRKHFNS